MPLVFGASYGWLLSPTWFVGFNVYAGGLDTCCDDFNVIFGGHARAYLSQQNKSMYVGSRLGIGLWGLAVGPEVGYDFGKWSVGVSSWLGECAWTVGLVAGYNF